MHDDVPSPSGAAMVCGILGDPVRHSLSPWMHRLFAAQTGQDLVYAPFPTTSTDLGLVLAGLRAAGLRGLNLTIPHKETVLPYLTQIAPDAAAIGAVNTLRFEADGLRGDNTDAPGFLRALQRHAGDHWALRPALILGAGGAARAIVHALGSAGVPEILLANRDLARAHSMVQDFPHLPLRALALSPESLRPHLPNLGLVVNCTARGLHGESHPELALELLDPTGSVCDIVYNPLHTPLIRAARDRGLRVVDGLGMLVEQGAESFSLWTGVMPDPEPVEERLRQWLSAQTP
ncbi:MAG: shikimate dehydrogenase [Acidithiobacillus sp.]